MGALTPRGEQLKGTRLGAYEVGRVIGLGATASVFEGTHVALGKPVAIKVLHEHIAGDEHLRHRFLREGKIAGRLRHPNIVEVLDVGLEGSVPFLVMELLTGGDLRNLLADTRVLTLERALSILLPIASGLVLAHELGIIHRDLKPANVFLARDTRDDMVPKLIDFGLSKSTTGATSSLTESELVAGTALYMSPEQTLGVKNASAASDQYSLAAILYESITGQPPFAPDAVHVLLERIRNDAVRPPSHINGALPEALDDVMYRAMNRDSAKRFPDVRALGRALLPLADAATAGHVERDFAERTTGKARLESRPSVKRAPAAAETRRESSQKQAVAKTLGVSAGDPAAPLPCAPGTSPFHIKGMSYRGLLRLIEGAVPGGLEAFCDALPDPRLREFLHQRFLATVRYDILPFVPLVATLARLYGAPFEDVVRRAAFGQCRYDAKTVFKMMFSSDKVEDITQYFPRFNAQYYDFGKFRSEVSGQGRFALEVAGIPAYIFPWFGPMYPAYAEEAARVVGAKEVRTVSQTIEPDGSHGGYPLVRSRSELVWS